MIYSIKVRTQADYGLGRKALFGAGLGAFYGGLGGSIYDKHRVPKENESWISRNRGAVIGVLGGAGAGYLLGNRYDNQDIRKKNIKLLGRGTGVITNDFRQPTSVQKEAASSFVENEFKKAGTPNPTDFSFVKEDLKKNVESSAKTFNPESSSEELHRIVKEEVFPKEKVKVENVFGNTKPGFSNDLSKVKPSFDSTAKKSASDLLDLAEQYKSIDYNGGSKLRRSRDKVLNSIKAFRKQQKLHPEKTYSKNNIVDALNSYRRVQDKAINDGNVGTEQALYTLNTLREKYKFKSNYASVNNSRYL